VDAFNKALAGQRLTCGEAKAVFAVARAQLDSTELSLGWTASELTRLGVAKPDSAGKLHAQWPKHWVLRALWPKLLGLILTAIAVSLGAPFWFDLLNKIINIRSAGRAPDERPKDPEAKDKRLAGLAPR
jgi:hypothetical protein